MQLPRLIQSALIATGLRFPGAPLEQAFQEEYRARSVGQFRAAALLGAATFAAFGFLDPLVVDDAGPSQLVRYGLAVPTLLLFFGLTFPSRLRRGLEAGAAIVGFVAGLAGVLIMVVSDLPTDYGHAGVMVILLYVFTFARLRVGFSLAAATGILATYELGAIYGTGMTVKTIVYNNYFLLSTFVVGASAAFTLERFNRRDFLRERELDEERQRSDRLLLNVLPESIAQRLKANASRIADSYSEVTVLFADIVGFTPRSEKISPQQLVDLLDTVFTRFDLLAERHGLEKIKTIGDAYMAVGGVPNARADHASAAAEMALDMREAAAALTWPDGEALSTRIGISSGPVVAGVIGQSKFAYDLWGSTVNTASRMESQGPPGGIQVSEETYAQLKAAYAFEARGQVEIRGKGPMTTYLLLGRLTAVAPAP